MFSIELHSRPVKINGVKKIKRTVWRPRNAKQFLWGFTILAAYTVAVIVSFIALGLTLYGIS